MNCNFNEKIEYLKNNSLSHLLLKGTWGIEKENLRVVNDGNLALSFHPKNILNANKYGFYTVDFSESQLEMVTNPFDSIEKVYEALEYLNKNAQKKLYTINEYLWPNSMPAILPDEKDIPIAKFPEEEKHFEIYRKGLALRYGKKMQMISGIHYNYSMSDELIEVFKEISVCGLSNVNFKNNLYFCLGRNILKYSWFLIYLFGASPIVDSSYEKSTIELLKKIEKLCDCCGNVSDYYNEYTTSIRMSWLGYNGLLKNGIHVSYNNLGEYLSDIKNGLETKSDYFEKLGQLSQNEQVQLNTNILQKSSEYYAPIRFKSTSENKNISFDELLKNGVDYLELRLLDLNPFSSNGITISELRFIHVFILFCMMDESPYFEKSDYNEINENLQNITLMGRKPDLQIMCNRKNIYLKDKCNEIVEKMEQISKLLDEKSDLKLFSQSMDEQKMKLIDNNLLPSQKIIDTVINKHKSFITMHCEIMKMNTAENI